MGRKAFQLAHRPQQRDVVLLQGKPAYNQNHFPPGRNTETYFTRRSSPLGIDGVVDDLDAAGIDALLNQLLPKGLAHGQHLGGGA